MIEYVQVFMACMTFFLPLLPFFLRGQKQEAESVGQSPEYVVCTLRLGAVFVPFFAIGIVFSFNYLQTFCLIIGVIAVCSGFPFDLTSPAIEWITKMPKDEAKTIGDRD